LQNEKWGIFLLNKLVLGDIAISTINSHLWDSRRFPFIARFQNPVITGIVEFCWTFCMMIREPYMARCTYASSRAWKRQVVHSGRYRSIRKFSCSQTFRSYDDTITNLKIGSHTRVIFQGFTGKQGTANARESLAWGTNIVGGVKPNSEGEHLGLPVLPNVRKAVEVLKPDATGIYVAAHQAPAAIEEAIEAEIPLIVAVAEHIPLHNILRVGFMKSHCPGDLADIVN
jgi:CoA binding domain